MNTLEDCKHGGSAPVRILQSLPISQARTARHKCTICSYQKGFEDAQWGTPLLVQMEGCDHRKIAPFAVLADLPESQAGTGRHKCATCAYQAGFEDGLKEHAALNTLLSGRVTRPGRAATAPLGKGTLAIVRPPDLLAPSAAPSTTFKARKILERSLKDHRNVQLGRAGELLVLDYEREYLRANGKADLVPRVVHTSEVEGDGAGFDIKSFDLAGKIKYIEVKTTRGSQATPFYVTYNEVEFSKLHPNQYYIYRVFDFKPEGNSARSYIVQGRIDKSFNLSATVFRATR